jgi:hypothetical protein
MPRKVIVFIVVVAVFVVALLWLRRGETPIVRAPDVVSTAPRSDAAKTTAPAEPAPDEHPAIRTPTSQEPTRPAIEDRPQPTRLAPAKRAPAAAPRSAVEAMLDAPIDRNHAIDLFAEHLAKLEQDGDGDPTTRESAQRLRDFAARANGGDDSQRLAQALKARLEDWLAQFSSERANHLALISLECKAGQCQILLAESSVDLTSDAGRNAMDLVPTLIALTQTPAWQPLGVAFSGSDMTAAGADPDGVPRYALWTIYLSVMGAG